MLGRKFHSGQKLRISADEFNSFVDAAKDHQARQVSAGAPQPPFNDAPPTILVRNDSGEVVPRFGILGIAAPLILPADNLNEFQNQTAVSGVSPVAGEHDDKFVIVAEPLAEGVIGDATVTGTSPVQINVTDEAHTHATIIDGVVAGLESAESGLGQILWKEAGTGVKWGIVRIGAVGDPQDAFDTVVLTARPTISDRTLEVRKVQYHGRPPVQGEYVWVDQPFIAFPDFGHAAIDYVDLFEAVLPFPAPGDNFLRVFQDRGDPIVEFPGTDGADVATVVLTVKPIAVDLSLMVRKVRYTTSPPVEGVEGPPILSGYEWDGDEFVAYPDFGSAAIDYAEFYNDIETVPDTDDTFLKVFIHQGDPIVKFPAAGGGRRLQLQAAGPDHLECTDAAGTVVMVAKPWLVRRTPFDGPARTRNGVTYAYTHDDRRIATVGIPPDEETEIQVVTPDFVVGDEIYAIRVDSTGVVVDDIPVTLLAQDDSRAFAKVDE